MCQAEWTVFTGNIMGEGRNEEIYKTITHGNNRLYFRISEILCWNNANIHNKLREGYGLRYKWYEQIFMYSGVGRKYWGGGGNGTEILWYVQYILHYSYSYY